MAAEVAAPAAAPPPPAPPEETAAEGTDTPAEGEGTPTPVEGTPAVDEKAAAAPPEPPPERETALFRKGLKIREEGLAAKQKAEQLLGDVRREREAIAKERGELQQLRAHKEAIDADPWQFFEIFKVDPSDFARRMMNQNDPIRVELASEKKARIALEERLERERVEREDQQLQGRVSTAKSNFVRFLSHNSETYPDIADEDEHEIAEVFWELASEHHKNTKQVPTFEMVAGHLQQQAEAKRAKKEQRRQQRGAPVRAATPGGGQTAPQRAVGQPATGPGPRAPSTLTNADTTTRSSLPREGATEEEIDAWAARELQKAFRKDADS